MIGDFFQTWEEGSILPTLEGFRRIEQALTSLVGQPGLSSNTTTLSSSCLMPEAATILCLKRGLAQSVRLVKDTESDREAASFSAHLFWNWGNNCWEESIDWGSSFWEIANEVHSLGQEYTVSVLYCPEYLFFPLFKIWFQKNLPIFAYPPEELHLSPCNWSAFIYLNQFTLLCSPCGCLWFNPQLNKDLTSKSRCQIKNINSNNPTNKT